MAEFHHGITGRETASGKIPIRDAATAVIAMLAFADDADEEAFPLDTPVLINSINRVLPKAGTTGNLRKNLEIIAQITSPTLVVIRINDPNGEVLDQSLVIGTTEDAGQRTGLQALLTVKSVLGITPKIICVPDVETIDVANAIGVICKKLRAYSYITPRNNNGVILSTASDLVRYRDMLASREIEIIWPEWTSGNVFLGIENNLDETCESTQVELNPISFPSFSPNDLVGIHVTCDWKDGRRKSNTFVFYMNTSPTLYTMLDEVLPWLFSDISLPDGYKLHDNGGSEVYLFGHLSSNIWSGADGSYELPNSSFNANDYKCTITFQGTGAMYPFNGVHLWMDQNTNRITVHTCGFQKFADF